MGSQLLSSMSILSTLSVLCAMLNEVSQRKLRVRTFTVLSVNSIPLLDISP